MPGAALPGRWPRRPPGWRTSAATPAAGAPPVRPTRRTPPDHRRRSTRGECRVPPRSLFNEGLSREDDLDDARLAVGVQHDRDPRDLSTGERAGARGPGHVDSARQLAALDEQHVEALRIPGKLRWRMDLDRDVAAVAMDELRRHGRR